ncbi:maestro heat-like repeat-containing protein family member 1 [Ambystoma mexicanum]|uniref:maestro heat-like repeat-containing protein family member 1 n=1 Tax=Ambystoma mexicanum TaxID=8296 RepID=UPI0037E93A9D
MWSVLSIEPVVNTQILLLLHEKLMESPQQESNTPLDSNHETIPEKAEAPTERPAALNALYVMLLVTETKLLIPELFPPLLQSLLLIINSSSGLTVLEDGKSSKKKNMADPNIELFDPMRCALQALNILLRDSGYGLVIDKMETAHGWENLQSTENYRAGLSQLVRTGDETRPRKSGGPDRNSLAYHCLGPQIISLAGQLLCQIFGKLLKEGQEFIWSPECLDVF